MTNQSEKGDRKIIRLVFEGDPPADRLDRYLGRKADLDLSRSKAQKLIESGLITVNGQKASHNHMLKPGDLIEIIIPPPETSAIVPEDIPLKIVYEDEYFLVVDKPAGMATHPAAGNFAGTLVNALLSYSKKLSQISGFERAGIVHRLDKNTSGLLIVAKTDEVHLKFQTALKERRITKIYLALICGHMKNDCGVIDLPIGRSIKNRKKMTVTKLKGRPATTEYRLLERRRLYDLLEINLRTGRTHQIRVHFSHLGHPIFGDAEYGGRQRWHKGIYSADKIMAAKALEIMPRQALHAQKLEFAHPVTGKTISLTSDLPDDFRALLDFLRRE
jgi:23S rRNA pseudouridine1911/1915/1917 synthase